MYDFIKAVIPPHYMRRLLEHPFLDFKGQYSDKTGAVASPKRIAEYKGLKIIVYDSGYIEIQGSIHKFKNGGLHNYDNFTLADVIAVNKEIEQFLKISFAECRLKNVEFGVNITPPIRTKDILNNLLCYRHNKFKDVSIRSGNFKEAEFQQYSIKVYDKYVQYRKKFNLTSPVLRFELKCVKMMPLNEIGIFSIGDLTKEQHYTSLKTVLLEKWGNVLLYDQTIVIKGLKGLKMDLKCNQWQNPYYWLNLPKQVKCKQKKAYQKVVRLHSQNVHEQISDLIAEKWDELSGKGLPINQYQMKESITI